MILVLFVSFCFVVSMGMKKTKMYFYGSETISD